MLLENFGSDTLLNSEAQRQLQGLKDNICLGTTLGLVGLDSHAHMYVFVAFSYLYLICLFHNVSFSPPQEENFIERKSEYNHSVLLNISQEHEPGKSSMLKLNEEA